ncbi:hypothetical protein ACFUEN_29245 [Streptomyces griseorubiginosus]|uniref:hypothetical protein n=1 Tax=Streptomyces griseorubiginosus TaxID=67304 RepID=UPI0036381259
MSSDKLAIGLTLLVLFVLVLAVLVGAALERLGALDGEPDEAAAGEGQDPDDAQEPAVEKWSVVRLPRQTRGSREW